MSWFYNKLRGTDGNGGSGGFSPTERERLRVGLVDFATRLRAAAQEIHHPSLPFGEDNPPNSPAEGVVATGPSVDLPIAV